jgi:purine nucleoside phosphorylase
MEKHEVTHLEKLTRELRSNLRTLAEDKDLEQFLITIRHPGFTTPAELALFRGVVDGMLAQTKAITSLKQVLVSAAAMVELNPQPLPP